MRKTSDGNTGYKATSKINNNKANKQKQPA